MIAREIVPLQNSAAKDRVTGAALALLLQIGFIAAFLHALPLMAPPKQLEHELTFFLPRLAPLPESAPPKTKTAPRTPALPVFVPPPLFSLPAPATPQSSAPPAALQNFGQALFGCTPETYNNLTPQQQAACRGPGEGVAIQDGPNPMGAPSHVKDEPRWANALAHEQSPVLLPGGSKDGKLFTIIGMDDSGKVTGLLGGSADPESWPTYDVTTYAPEDFYKQEQATDAWNKAHAPAKIAGTDTSGTKSVSVHPQ